MGIEVLKQSILLNKISKQKVRTTSKDLFLQEVSVLLVLVKLLQRRPGELLPDGQLVPVVAFVRQHVPGQVVPQRLQVHRVVRLLVDRLRVRARPAATSGLADGVVGAPVLELGLLVDLFGVGLAAVAVAVDVGDGESRLLVGRRHDDAGSAAVRQRLLGVVLLHGFGVLLFFFLPLNFTSKIVRSLILSMKRSS